MSVSKFINFYLMPPAIFVVPRNINESLHCKEKNPTKLLLVVYHDAENCVSRRRVPSGLPDPAGALQHHHHKRRKNMGRGFSYIDR